MQFSSQIQYLQANIKNTWHLRSGSTTIRPHQNKLVRCHQMMDGGDEVKSKIWLPACICINYFFILWHGILIFSHTRICSDTYTQTIARLQLINSHMHSLIPDRLSHSLRKIRRFSLHTLLRKLLNECVVISRVWFNK